MTAKRLLFSGAVLVAGILTASGLSLAAVEVKAVKAFPELRFERPLDIQSPKDGSGRLFVVEQDGVIKAFKADAAVRETRVFLDIRDRVAADAAEQGLLGLAFHPEFKTNRFFYVNYVADGPLRTVIARFEADPADGNRARADSERVLLEIAQPYSNHNGGQLSFGPDGFLYIGMGDGGSSGDPHGHAQDRSSLLGKMLRIDVDGREEGLSYGIPPDNPYARNSLGYRREIYAYGLRNPWRFSWDAGGRMWVADVGQWKYEEIHWLEKGKNYGWNIMEGSHCFKPKRDCGKDSLERPVIEYGRSEGRSVIGGFVYRGRVASLKGRYIYADFVSGRIWTTHAERPRHRRSQALKMDPLPIASFGEDETGELFIASFDGSIYRLVES